METVLITQNIYKRRTYDYEIDYTKGWLIKRNVKDKYSPQVTLQIQLSENLHPTETSQITNRKNELTGSYKTQALTERSFRTDYKTIRHGQINDK